MKKTNFILYLLLVLFIAIISCQPETKKTADEVEVKAVSGYDSLKAAAYGADAYGMKKYVMAFLKRGPNRDRDSTEAAQLQSAHLQNIRRLAKEGKLLLAGPFFDDGDLRGIYLFNVETLEEAEALTNTDPAIKAGSLVLELKEWYGSAALMAINEIHPMIAKEKIE